MVDSVWGRLRVAWRAYGAAVITLVGIAVGVYAQFAYQMPPEPERKGYWIAIAIAGLGIAAATPLVDAEVRRRKRKTLEAKIKDARQDQVVQINDALDPLVEKLSELVMTPAVARPAAARSLIVQALNSLAYVIGPERTRVSYYEADAVAEPYRLVCKESAGRHTRPKTTFHQDRPDGEWVIGLLQRDEPHFCESVKKAPPPGWDGSRRRTYETFISVPASVASEAVGMITVDAPAAGDLKEQDIPLIRVIGTIIAASVRIADAGQDGREDGVA
jgi:hypothetical protein